MRADWVRAGIMSYGRAPDFPAHDIAHWDLQPDDDAALRLIATQTLAAGDAVGYGSRFVAEGAMRIGIVACGYADGYPRLAPTGTPVLVDGVRTRTVGRVSMDMLTVDLTPVPGARAPAARSRCGAAARAAAVLPIDEVAHAAGTIGYELMCALAPRVPVSVESSPAERRALPSRPAPKGREGARCGLGIGRRTRGEGPSRPPRAATKPQSERARACRKLVRKQALKAAGVSALPVLGADLVVNGQLLVSTHRADQRRLRPVAGADRAGCRRRSARASTSSRGKVGTYLIGRAVTQGALIAALRAIGAARRRAAGGQARARPSAWRRRRRSRAGCSCACASATSRTASRCATSCWRCPRRACVIDV